jgi:hypothetical protein
MLNIKDEKHKTTCVLLGIIVYIFLEEGNMIVKTR